jgi:hypothetical protein
MRLFPDLFPHFPNRTDAPQASSERLSAASEVGFWYPVPEPEAKGLVHATPLASCISISEPLH